MISKVLAAITASITATLSALMLAPSAFALVPPDPTGEAARTLESTGVPPWQVVLVALGALVVGAAVALVISRGARVMRERHLAHPATT